MENSNTPLRIGIDAFPLSVKHSNILSSHDLGLLSTVEEVPFVNPAFDDERLKNIIQYYCINPDEMETELHLYAKELLAQNKVAEAWQVLLSSSF